VTTSAVTAGDGSGPFPRSVPSILLLQTRRPSFPTP
jgi:hypothetical protein